jgi:hypothetical protein
MFPCLMIVMGSFSVRGYDSDGDQYHCNLYPERIFYRGKAIDVDYDGARAKY